MKSYLKNIIISAIKPKGSFKKTTAKTSVSGSQFLDKLSEIKNRPVKTETFKPKKQGPKTQYQLTLDAIGSLDTKIKKKLKEKIKTGKFDKRGNPSN